MSKKYRNVMLNALKYLKLKIISLHLMVNGTLSPKATLRERDAGGYARRAIRSTQNNNDNFSDQFSRILRRKVFTKKYL